MSRALALARAGIALYGDTSGNIGLGVAAAADGRITLGRIDTSNEGGQINLCRSSDNNAQYSIDVYGSGTTPSLRIIDNVAAATRFQIDSAGNSTFAGNLVLTSGKGIDFSSHSNASGMSSELLDDYEVGTWTPAIQGLSGGACTMTSGASGTYTRIGNFVYCTCYLITWSSKTTLVGNVILSGFPFTLKMNQRFAGQFGTSPSGSLSFTGQPVFGADGGSTYCWFIYRDGSNNTYTHMSDANINSSGTIYGVTFAYVV